MNFDFVTNATAKELEQFKSVCNQLLSRTYIVRTTYQPGKGRVDNPDYLFLSRHYEAVQEYLSLLDWDLRRDALNGYFYVLNTDEANRCNLNKKETAILLALRLIYEENGESGPVTLNCDKSCYVVEGNLWKGQLDNIQDSIVFIDEGNEFVKTKDFARAIQQTDNYYVIVTREGLPALPYSVEEVYGIRTSGKYGSLKQSYHSFYRIYPDSTTENIKPEKILTEDSNSGYQFFDAVCKEQQIQCDTANGKSNVFSY